MSRFPSLASISRLAIRRPRNRPILYLVATAGHPNYGDELITRSWLDTIRAIRPDAQIWVDTPHPGRAVHLFGDVPDVRFTSTLWELAMSSPSHDPLEDAWRVSTHVRDLGTPRVDPGLLLLRSAQSIHVLGGGYLNDLWQDNLGLITAVAEAGRLFDIRTYATGLGLMPLETARQAWLATMLRDFSHVEVRDEPSASIIGSPTGYDDAFLAINGSRRVFDATPAPKAMVLVQGDLKAWSDEAAVESIHSFLGTRSGAGVGMVEAVAPDDAAYRDASEVAQFYPFDHVWRNGFPASPGQQWLTTRFHAHLMAAAAGASGTILAGRLGYYDHKHESLLALGTGWNLQEAGTVGEELAPTSNPEFPERAREIGRLKYQLALQLYAT